MAVTNSYRNGWIATIMVGVVLYAALLVLRSPSRRDAVAISTERLRMLHQAVALYQEVQGPMPATGNFTQLHLPSLLALSQNVLNLAPQTYDCPCYRKTKSQLTSPQFDYWIEGDPTEILSRTSPLFTTLDCDPHPKTVGSPMIPHRGLGVRVDGTLIDQTKSGDVTDPDWWTATEDHKRGI